MNDPTLKALYDSDFEHWLEKTIDYLENQQFNHLDIQHLIEELVDLGRSEKKALESNLMILIAHLLKFLERAIAVNHCFSQYPLVSLEIEPDAVP